MIEKDAILSQDQKYRYMLSRVWSRSSMVAFLQFNPSTANAAVDDATIRKNMGFASRWGYGGIVIVNLFAYRSRDPKALLYVDDPVGPENDWYILRALEMGGISELVCAWGCAEHMRGNFRQERKRALLTRIREVYPALSLQCLGMNKTGEPRHPLMLSYETKVEPFGL